MTTQTAEAAGTAASFLPDGPPPDRTRAAGWQQWRATREDFIPARRMSPEEYQALGRHDRWVYDLHRMVTHVNLQMQETPMSTAVNKLIVSRLRNNAGKRSPGTRDGLMINGEAYAGKTETSCWAAAEFEDMWRATHARLRPEPAPGVRDTYVPVGYCRLPPRATPKGLCQVIMDIYGDVHPSTRHDLIRATRDAVLDHRTTGLLIDDITRLQLQRQDDQDTLDLIRELMDIGVTLVLIGVDIPQSGLLRGARRDPRTGQWCFPAGSHADSTAAGTGRRFDLVNLRMFGQGDVAFTEHIAGIEDQLRLLNATEGMLTGGGMPDYLYERTYGSVGLLRRLIEDGCAAAMETGEERLTRGLLEDIDISLESLSDLDPEAGEIPRIPERARPKKPAKDRAGKRRPRNTVFDDHGAPAGE
jgi:hypothetical protein